MFSIRDFAKKGRREKVSKMDADMRGRDVKSDAPPANPFAQPSYQGASAAAAAAVPATAAASSSMYAPAPANPLAFYSRPIPTLYTGNAKSHAALPLEMQLLYAKMKTLPQHATDTHRRRTYESAMATRRRSGDFAAGESRFVQDPSLLLERATETPEWRQIWFTGKANEYSSVLRSTKMTGNERELFICSLTAPKPLHVSAHTVEIPPNINATSFPETYVRNGSSTRA
jgi:hypothetical protein